MKELLPLHIFKKSLVLIAVLYSSYYFYWRATESFHPGYPVYSKVFYALELIGFMNMLMFVWSSWKLRKRESQPIKTKFSVDVFIPTYNEDPAVLKPAIYHAVNMDYPHQTYVLDDGRRPEIKELALSLGAHYLTREDNKGAKAGNMNAALSKTSGDVIVVFDADGVPRRDFITKLLGYFEDPKVALVQTPQTFYNLDSFQHDRPVAGEIPWTEQSLFFDVCQPGRDQYDAAMCCGSGSMIRRSALEAIGNFPMKSMTEDFHMTLMFHHIGLKTFYHSEPLAYALAPATVDAFVVQRARWALGSIQMLRMEWRKVFGPSKMTLPQRLSYLTPIYYLTGIQKTCFYFAPVLYLLFGIAPINDIEMIIPIVLYTFLSFLSFRILSRGRGRIFMSEVFMTYTAIPFARAVLIGLFPGLGKRFSVTPKGMKSEQLWRYALPSFLITITSLTGTWVGIERMMNGDSSDGTLLSSVFSVFFFVVGISALKRLRHEPVSDKTYSFFDVRHARISALNGNEVQNSSLAVATILSDHAIRIVANQGYVVGDQLQIELCIPTATLDLLGKIKRVYHSNHEELVDLEVEIQNMTEKQHLQFIHYAFEDVTTEIHSAQMREQERGGVAKPLVDDRRVRTRFKSATPIDIYPEDRFGLSLGVLSAVIKDCTNLDAGIETKYPIALGTRMLMNVPWADETIESRVVRCERSEDSSSSVYRVGVMLTKPSERLVELAMNWSKSRERVSTSKLKLHHAFASLLMFALLSFFVSTDANASGELMVTPTYYSGANQVFPGRVSLFVNEQLQQSSWYYSSWSGFGRAYLTDQPVSYTNWLTTQQDLSYQVNDRVRFGGGVGVNMSMKNDSRQYDAHFNLAVKLW